MKKEKLTPRKKAFCVKYVKHCNASRAYREAFGRGKALSDATCRSEGSKLLADPLVQAEIEKMQQKAEDEAVMSVRYKRMFLKECVDATPEQIGPKSRVCNGVTIDNKGKITYMMPSKLAAIELDNKLAGHHGPREDSDDINNGPSLADLPGMADVIKTLSEVWQKD